MSLFRWMPLDGLGWGFFVECEVGRCSRWASVRWYSKFPVVLRPLLYLANRLVWPFVALAQVTRFSRLRKLNVGAFLVLYLDCLLSGAVPVDAFVWRRLYGCSPPISARSAALLLREIGSNDGRALLSDKFALATQLMTAGVRVPRTHSVGNLLSIEELGRVIGPTGLFIKPRYGSGGRDALVITRSGDRWQIDGAEIDPVRLISHLAQMTIHGEMILQDRLVSADSLADLSWRERAPVLRLATSSTPDGQPQLDSVLLIIPRPGFKSLNFLNGQIYAPIDPVTGIIKCGVVLEVPDKMLDFREPDGPRISGRTVPFFAEAVQDALIAMSAVPPVPVTHWDIVLTQEGPVFLEGNSNGNWIVATLAGRFGLQIRPLATTLGQWLDAAPPARMGNNNAEALIVTE